MQTRLRFLVCPYLERELRAAAGAENFAEARVDPLSASCCFGQRQAQSSVLAPEAPETPDTHTIVFGGGCSRRRSAKEPLLESEPESVVPEQCHLLVAGQKLLDHHLATGAYVMTPGWLVRWRETISEWGFDQPTARAFFQETTKRLVLFDTGVYGDCLPALSSLSAFLDIPFEIVPVGLDLLRLQIRSSVLSWRLREKLEGDKSETTMYFSDYAMVFDLISSLTLAQTEQVAIARITELFATLFAPGTLCYHPSATEGPYAFSRLTGGHRWTDSNRGFVVAFSHGGEFFGALEVDELRFPEHKNHYLNLARIVSRVCGLAIATARALEVREQAQKEREGLIAELQQRTSELEAANKELEAFSYSVSHDLRAPLRAMSGFSQAVMEDYGPRLPPEGQEYLETICRGAKRMGELIDDLLAFSRLGRQSFSSLPVDTAKLVSQCLEDLESTYKNRVIEFTFGELPSCHGDRALLKQVWTNLLSNAIKFTNNRERALVQVGAQIEFGKVVYFIKDNGAGFDMKHANKLFGVFQRLHHNDEFEGTGVGLAIVQRIVHRHGGRVWADAVLNQGATFYFTVGEEGIRNYE